MSLFWGDLGGVRVLLGRGQGVRTGDGEENNLLVCELLACVVWSGNAAGCNFFLFGGVGDKSRGSNVLLVNVL